MMRDHSNLFYESSIILISNITLSTRKKNKLLANIFGQGHQEDITAGLAHELDLGNQSPLTPFPVFWNVCSACLLLPEAASKIQPWDRNVTLKLSGLGTTAPHSSHLSIWSGLLFIFSLPLLSEYRDWFQVLPGKLLKWLQPNSWWARQVTEKMSFGKEASMGNILSWHQPLWEEEWPICWMLVDYQGHPPNTGCFNVLIWGNLHSTL